MLPEKAEIIIIGGGSAGLSLAYHYAQQPSKRAAVTILESRSGYHNDRTWGFWDFDELDPVLRRLIRKKWYEWGFSCQDKIELHHSLTHPYCVISSHDFYRTALSVIAEEPSVTLQMDCRVYGITGTEGKYTISTSQGNITCQKIVDTRPPIERYHFPARLESVESSDITIPGAILYQIFYGVEVITSEEVFDPTIAGIMGDMSICEDGFAFLYMLPYSTRQALIEYTLFSPRLFSWETLKATCLAKVAGVTAGQSHTLAHEEGAFLPMGFRQSNTIDGGRITAGIAGGALRPATGYGFVRTQRWARKCAETLAAQGKLLTMQCDNESRLQMDNIFLHVLKRQPQLAPGMFMSIGKNVSGDAFARFMMEKSRWLDSLRVVLAMPKYPFLQQWLRSLYEK